MISNEKSVRLATRLLRVIERNPNTHPALNVIKDGIAERAGSFIKASEKWNTAMKLRVKERNEGLNAMNEFTATLRSYIPMIANSYPFLNISITNLIGTTPDDTLNFTDAIMEQIQAQPDFSTNTIANEFINNISPVWQNAMKEWAEYENSDSELRTASENMN
ncbi:MAG: hypothetical protein JXR95_04880, partial [Deltaproteobacteria bacterium]|nr:hypothetical protein [Deltaproteobacteria bacterium]